jgi:hypothetical protein
MSEGSFTGNSLKSHQLKQYTTPVIHILKNAIMGSTGYIHCRRGHRSILPNWWTQLRTLAETAPNSGDIDIYAIENVVLHEHMVNGPMHFKQLPSSISQEHYNRYIYW